MCGHNCEKSAFAPVYLYATCIGLQIMYLNDVLIEAISFMILSRIVIFIVIILFHNYVCARKNTSTSNVLNRLPIKNRC